MAKQPLQDRKDAQHISDYIRLISLYESVGFCLDLDCVVLKPLDEKFLHNYFLLVEGMVAKQFNNGDIHFEAKHRLVKEFISSLRARADSFDSHLLPKAVLFVFCRCQSFVSQLLLSHRTTILAFIFRGFVDVFVVVAEQELRRSHVSLSLRQRYVYV